MKQIRKRLTYANVMSSIAVFVVLGGAAVAASQLPKNSVGAKQLKKNAVTTAKIKKNAVTAAKVKDGSLQGSDFAAGQLPAGPKGDVGPTFGRAADDGCGDVEEEFEVCASTGTITLPASGRVLLVGTSNWDNDEAAAPNAGDCRLTADGNQVGPTVALGEQTTTHTIGHAGSVALTTVTGVLSAGNHTFALECSEDEPEVFFEDSMISAVLLGGS